MDALIQNEVGMDDENNRNQNRNRNRNDDDEHNDPMVEDDEEEEEEDGGRPEDDEEEEDEEEEEDDDEDGPQNNAIDGGSADPGDDKKLSTDCSMFLRLEFVGSPFPTSQVPPNHPIYQPGVTVSIGLEKTTKLSAVFSRYCKFANSYVASSTNANNGGGNHANADNAPPGENGNRPAPAAGSASKSKSAQNHRDNYTSNNAQPPPSNATPTVHYTELEFSHCSILDPDDTAELSALMKNDTIQVRKCRLKEREAFREYTRWHRESDKRYFHQLRNLLLVSDVSSGTSGSGGGGKNDSPVKTKGSCDVVFHCKGRIRDFENGYQQEVLTSYVRGHSAMLCKRCPWLRGQIDVAKGDFSNVGDDDDDDDDDDRGIVMGPRRNGGGNGNDNNDDNNGNGNGNGNAVPVEYDEDDENGTIHENNDGNESSMDERMPVRYNIRNILNNANDRSNAANAVPIDGGDENGDGGNSSSNNNGDSDAGDDVIPYIGSNFPNMLRVPISHPPEAVKLLLEFCYTNRVIPLGQKAFVESYKPTEWNKIDPLLRNCSGPVSPFHNGFGGMRPSSLSSSHYWPSGGKPTVSLPVALAGIQLAEEAHMPRLALMCEIAASQLVNASTALEALALCEQQYRQTGNRLKILRKTVMLHHVLSRGGEGVGDLSSMPSFKRILKEKSDIVVPSLMMGVMETVKDVLGEKDNPNCKARIQRIELRKEETSMILEAMDDDDSRLRSEERRKWREKRWKNRRESDKNPYKIEGYPDFDKMAKRVFPQSDRNLIDLEQRIMFASGSHSLHSRLFDFADGIGSGCSSSKKSGKSRDRSRFSYTHSGNGRSSRRRKR